jgi:hypothetical protein
MIKKCIPTTDQDPIKDGMHKYISDNSGVVCEEPSHEGVEA